MGKIKGFLLNRKQYDRIRKMVHCQMTLYVESIYKSGYADGQKAAEGLTALEIRDVLLKVKGLGEKRVDTIVSALEEAMNSKEDKKSDSKRENQSNS